MRRTNRPEAGLKTRGHVLDGVLSGPDAPPTALIDTCVHCGFCLPTCPTYLLWGEEMDSPRGRIYLMKAGIEGRAELTPSFVAHFDNCLGCLACVTACPSGVQYGPLIERTRAQIEQKYPRPAGDRWFRRALMAVLPYPWRMRLALLPLALMGGLVRAVLGTAPGGARPPGAAGAAALVAGGGAAGDARRAVREPAGGHARRRGRSA